MRMSVKLMILALLAGLMLYGCDQPKVQANIQIPISNQLGLEVPPGVFEAALAAINAELGTRLPSDVHVSLFQASSLRALDEANGLKCMLVYSPTKTGIEVHQLGNLISIDLPPGAEVSSKDVQNQIVDAILVAVQNQGK